VSQPRNPKHKKNEKWIGQYVHPKNPEDEKTRRAKPAKNQHDTNCLEKYGNANLGNFRRPTRRGCDWVSLRGKSTEKQSYQNHKAAKIYGRPVIQSIPFHVCECVLHLSFCPTHGFPNNWKINGDYPPPGGQRNSFLGNSPKNAETRRTQRIAELV
jgi:hypothetical protein